MQPYPEQTMSRESLIVSDVCYLLHDQTEATVAKVKRWIQHVLNEAKMERRWWFLDNLATTTLAVGNDVVDLDGHLDTVNAVYCPLRLIQISLTELVEMRQFANFNNKPNAGRPDVYALEGGRRVHLWPCPNVALAFAALYSRPIHVEIVPEHWETIILNGVLGLYGRHFDRDALTQEPAEFERRFYQALRKEHNGSRDMKLSKRWHYEFDATSIYSADSAIDAAVTLLTPASLTGIGYVSIELGDYPQSIPV